MTTPRWLALCVVVGVVAFAWGRQTSSPAAVDAQERSSEAVAVSSEASATVEREATTEATEATERVVYRERFVYRDGPVQEVTREVEAEESRLELHAQAREVEVRVETVEVLREVEVERRIEVTAPLPDWRLSGMAGLSYPAGLTYGAQVERRILGPVYLGAWGLSHGAGGISVGVTF